MRRTRPALDVVVVLVTCPTRAVAKRIAAQLVARHLAACVNIVPTVESLFWWKGAVERCRESLLLIKTPAARFSHLKRAVVALHPYETPEIIALPIKTGHAPYVTWIHASTRHPAAAT